MNNVNSFLIDWSIRFLENRDTIKGEIINIEKGKNGFDFIINYKDKINYYIIVPILDTGILNKIKDDNHYGIFTLNNMGNIGFVLSNWEKLTSFKFLNIYFVNPFSNSDKVWIISPYIHEKVCDKMSLESGLKSMAEMVETISVEELNKRLNH